MELWPRGRMKKRLAIWGAFFALAYAFVWWCTWCPGDRTPGKPRVDLVTLEAALRRSVKHLAITIGERNLSRRAPQLDQAADWIAAEWRTLGLTVREHRYPIGGATARNLETDIAGPESAPIVLIGAHYDSVIGSPGADDNASGVAVLLEVARALVRAPLAARLRLVAFTCEEPPYFYNDEMGSRVYAKMARARGDRIQDMVSLETLGYFADEPRSQTYPQGLAHFYPDRGNFVGVVSNVSNRDAVVRAVKLLRPATDVPVESAALWGALPGVYWSDHSSFWLAGYPGIMLTDTAPFRNPYYHGEHDLPQAIDHRRLARVAAGVIEMVRGLASEVRP